MKRYRFQLTEYLRHDHRATDPLRTYEHTLGLKVTRILGHSGNVLDPQESLELGRSVLSLDECADPADRRLREVALYTYPVYIDPARTEWFRNRGTVLRHLDALIEEEESPIPWCARLGLEFFVLSPAIQFGGVGFGGAFCPGVGHGDFQTPALKTVMHTRFDLRSLDGRLLNAGDFSKSLIWDYFFVIGLCHGIDRYLTMQSNTSALDVVFGVLMYWGNIVDRFYRGISGESGSSGVEIMPDGEQITECITDSLRLHDHSFDTLDYTGRFELDYEALSKVLVMLRIPHALFERENGESPRA